MILWKHDIKRGDLAEKFSYGERQYVKLKEGGLYLKINTRATFFEC